MTVPLAAFEGWNRTDAVELLRVDEDEDVVKDTDPRDVGRCQKCCTDFALPSSRFVDDYPVSCEVCLVFCGEALRGSWSIGEC